MLIFEQFESLVSVMTMDSNLHCPQKRPKPSLDETNCQELSITADIIAQTCTLYSGLQPKVSQTMTQTLFPGSL